MAKAKKTTAELVTEFANLACSAGIARAAMTRARRRAKELNLQGTTMGEVSTKRKFQAAYRKLWALADRIDWAEAVRDAGVKS